MRAASGKLCCLMRLASESGSIIRRKDGMSAPWILIVGMLVVVCGVLLLKLHALLSLIAGGLVVALLTPANNTYRAAARLVAIPIEAIDPATGTVTLKADKSRPAEGAVLLVLRLGQRGEVQPIGSLRVTSGGGAKTFLAKAAATIEVDRRDLVIEPAKMPPRASRRS